jgi:hypothetical protein
MKKKILFILSFFSILDIHAQNSMFINSKNGDANKYVNLNLVCDGNSLTYAAFDGGLSYPEQINIMFPFNMNGGFLYNKGIGGQTTQMMIDDALTDIDIHFFDGKKNIVVAWECGNDLYFNGSVLGAYNRFVTYCLARKAKGWKVIIMTMPPRIHSTPFGDSPAVYEEKLQQVNLLLKNNWMLFSDYIIDLREDSRLATINPTYFFTDSIHMTGLGCGVVAEKVFKAIKSL